MITVLINPSCSKCRGALALLEQAAVPYQIRNYLDDPLDVAELSALAAALPGPLSDLVRPAGWDAGDPTTLPDQALIQGLANSPEALQRPILIAHDEADIDEQAIIARPPEKLVPWLKKVIK